MQTNRLVKSPPIVTHEGAPAVHLAPLKELRRSVLTALLWEDLFYESGAKHAKRVAALVPKVKPEEIAALAVEARDRMYLRHMPLFLVRELARVKGTGRLVAETLAHVIQRPDEMGEYLALYWRTKKDEPLSAGSKRALAAAFGKFNEYQLAKYDRDATVKLRDVLRLVHPKPKDSAQAALWGRVKTRTLATPDTWETALSGGADKKATFERLLREKKLGALATLRNLRNMISANVDPALVHERLAAPLDRVLPFRFLAAVRHAPMFADALDGAMLRAVEGLPPLPGRTLVLVDVSGSMDADLSAKSEMTRMDVGAGLAILLRQVCQAARVFTFSQELVEVPAFRGLALSQAISQSQAHGGTYLGAAVEGLRKVPHDRLVVVTDEQSHDRVGNPPAKGYLINVAAYERGVGYGPWVHVDGWSERVLDFVREHEAESWPR